MEGFNLVMHYMPYLLKGLLNTVVVSVCAI